jgi:hypothetical protein
MKRKQRKCNSEPLDLPVLPQELINMISDHVWKGSLRVIEFLNWHSTCKTFWQEYLDYSSSKIQTFVDEACEKNKELLKKTYLSVYKDNVIVLSRYENINHICDLVKKEIRSVADGLTVSPKTTNVRTVFELDWDEWEGMNFDSDDYLKSYCVEILMAVDARIRSRYSWNLFISYQDEEGRDFEVTPAFLEPIKKAFRISLQSTFDEEKGW